MQGRWIFKDMWPALIGTVFITLYFGRKSFWVFQAFTVATYVVVKPGYLPLLLSPSQCICTSVCPPPRALITIIIHIKLKPV